MDKWARGWRHEAVRVVPLTLLSLIGWILPTIAYGLTASGVANAVLFTAAVIVMVRWRGRHPVVLAVVLSLLMPFFPSLWLVAGWAFLSVATRLRIGATIGAGAVAYAGGVAMSLYSDQMAGGFRLDPEDLTFETVVGALVMNLLLTVALGAVGAYLGARRRERAAIEERLAAADQARVLAVENVRVEERNRIAREMHDVLAHKITLISLHAGALEYRDDLSPDEVRRAGATIRESSHDALVELRGILGQLRQTDDESGVPSKPQPGLADIGALVEEHREAGGKVVVERELEEDPPETIGRHVYRVLLEALTNAARHAPGTSVTVRIAGDAATGVTLTVRNRLSIARHDSPGAGLGLVGLRERVEYVGGRLEAGETPAGEFVVEAWLPWGQG